MFHDANIPGFSVRLDLDAIPWRATRSPGVHWYRIRAEVAALGSTRDAADDAVVLIRMIPDAGYPAHRHLGVEDVLVLQGGYRDEFGTYGPGAYIRYPAGSVHRPMAIDVATGSTSTNDRACVLFAIARGGVENIAEGSPDGPGASRP